MCSEKSHTDLNQHEHFARHVMTVAQIRNLARSGMRDVSLASGAKDAIEALSLKDNGVSGECIEMLEEVAALYVPEPIAS